MGIAGVDSLRKLYMGECELLAASCSIYMWAARIPGCILILRTDNLNALSRIVKYKTEEGRASRAIRRLAAFLLDTGCEVSPFYVRSARNISEDGLTRRAGQEALERLRAERMEQVDIPGQWIIDSFRIHQEEGPIGNHMRTFGIVGELYGFFIDREDAECDWNPSCYTTAGAMGDWGIPAERYGVTRPDVHELVASQVSIRTSGNIFSPIGKESRQMEIDDFKKGFRPSPSTLRFPHHAVLDS